jgi:hypothetical protein
MVACKSYAAQILMLTSQIRQDSEDQSLAERAVDRFAELYGYPEGVLRYRAVMWQHGSLTIHIYRFSWQHGKVVLRRVSPANRPSIHIEGPWRDRQRVFNTIPIPELNESKSSSTAGVCISMLDSILPIGDYHTQMEGASLIVIRRSEISLPKRTLNWNRHGTDWECRNQAVC